MIEEESIKLHQKYRRWLRYSIISIWLAAGLFWLISNWWERWEANQRSKFDKANLLWLVKNPNTLDFYEFQTFSQPSSGRKLVDYGRPIAKIFQVQGNKVGFIFSQKNLPSRPGSNIFYNTLFDDKNKRIDTVFLEQEEILKTLANDTVQVNLRDTSFFIIELLNISRINGPFFQPYMMQADKISLVNT